MSFLTDLFSGNFGNLGEDIAPQNIFKDFGSSFANQPGWAKGLEIGIPLALGTVLTAGALAPEAAAAEGGLAAADVGAGLSDTAITDLMASPGAEAFASVGDPAFTAGTGAIPFADVAGGLTGGGGTDLAGNIAGLEFAPSTEIATGGNVLPDVAAAGGGAGGGAAPFGGVSDTSLDLLGPGGAVTAPPLPTGPGAIAPGAAAAPTAAGTTAPTSLFGALGADLKAAAPWLGAAGLGYNLFQGYEQNQALKAEAADVKAKSDAVAAAGQASLSAAQPMLTTGEALMTGGPVPGPMQAMLDRMRNAERARIIQGYGARQQSTDPTQNSALAQDLNNLDTNLMAFREQIGQQIVTTANQMLSTGASATQIAAELPMMMQRLSIQLQQMTGNAIANFASAMSGSSSRVAGFGAGQNINLNLTGATPSLAA